MLSDDRDGDLDTKEANKQEPRKMHGYQWTSQGKLSSI